MIVCPFLLNGFLSKNMRNVGMEEMKNAISATTQTMILLFLNQKNGSKISLK